MNNQKVWIAAAGNGSVFDRRKLPLRHIAHLEPQSPFCLDST